jgi:hypothetical protein
MNAKKYVLVMTVKGGTQETIDAGYMAQAQAEAHGQWLKASMPEHYTGYSVREVAQ